MSTLAASVVTRVESLTGRVTMYRLVLTCLGGLALAALALSLLDVIPYQPAAMPLCLTVALAASYLSNRAFAGLFGVVPHSESTLITGYLLFFIFPPTLQLTGVLGIAVAAVLASASKYLLAFRGRHVFNPAAAGAFLLTLTGVYYSGWWAGTPAMLPFTAVAAILILHRTRRLPMAGVFLLSGVALMAIRSLADGQTLYSSVSWPLLSSPIVFFAAFMLSEPLTQPPRRRQQLMFAAVVGLLFSTPAHLGSVYLSPESALLIGNGVAFLFGQRKGIELVLRSRRTLSPSTVEFDFMPSRDLNFRPGQYLELTVPHRGPDTRGLRRVFTIASAPADGILRISTKVPPRASSFKKALGELAAGSSLTATSIAGDFLLPAADVPVLLIAGGIGITPFASQLADLPPDHGRDVVVIYSVAGESEICYRDVLTDSDARVIIVSGEKVGGLPANWVTVESSRVTAQILADQVPDIGRRHVMISGPPTMVSGIGNAARRLKAAHVRTDYFSGY